MGVVADDTVEGRAWVGLDSLETLGADGGAGSGAGGRAALRQLWAASWPKLGAVTLFVAAWQLVVSSGWRPDYVLPGPLPVGHELLDGLTDGTLVGAVGVTLRRAATGFALALLLGGVVGLAVSRFALFRSAVGSLITGLQTMPSVAWFPLALLLFQRSEGAITFVVVLGAAPSIANGVVSGADHVPPLLLRAGRTMGARGFGLYRTVVLPSSLPALLGGVKQGWAFAWRSLMAGELLVIIAGHQSLGVRMQNARDLSDAPALMAVMVVILCIGITVDGVGFSTMERTIRRRHGLVADAAG